MPDIFSAYRHRKPQDSQYYRVDDHFEETLARYVVLASFSQERMTYIPEESKVLYGFYMDPIPACA